MINELNVFPKGKLWVHIHEYDHSFCLLISAETTLAVSVALGLINRVRKSQKKFAALNARRSSHHQQNIFIFNANAHAHQQVPII